MTDRGGLYPSFWQRALWWILGKLPDTARTAVSGRPWWQRALVYVAEALIQKAK